MEADQNEVNNIFDGDKYDIMTNDNPNCIIKRSKGLPGDPRNLSQMLDDKSHVNTVRHRYEEYSLISEEIDENDPEYNDEYDDSYEALLEGEIKTKKTEAMKQIIADIEDQESESEVEEEKPVENKMNFCENPEVIRARYEAARAAKMANKKGYRPPPVPRDVVGKAKGQGQEKDVLFNRHKKDVNKSSRANHNRKTGSSMERWQSKVAVVTGAAQGIGASCVKALVRAGVIAIESQMKFHTIKCDISKEAEVQNVFDQVKKQFGGPDILINNAGIVRPGEMVTPGNSKNIIDTVNTNILGTYFCTREAFLSMKERQVDGHVVNLNSTGGHTAYFDGESYNICSGTKHAITAMTETYRQEFQRNGNLVKVTSISPGNVGTEFLTEDMRKTMPMLHPDDVADAIMYALSTPKHVQIHELIIKPMGEKYF
uniref:Uncharacterized protein n=1 Tax=Megaselia scalaris TaxID=36166 RepID=T1GED8_MEGSC